MSNTSSSPNSSRNTAEMTAADVMMEVLIEWGVDTIFGLPGDGINGIMEALRKRQDNRKTGSVPRDFRARGDPSSQWPL
jgi:hypothetical protein